MADSKRNALYLEKNPDAGFKAMNLAVAIPAKKVEKCQSGKVLMNSSDTLVPL